jgi:hypothetical protein
MSKQLFMKVLLASAVPMTGLVYLAASQYVSPDIAYAPAPKRTTPPRAIAPTDDTPTVSVLELPVYVEARRVAPIAKVEPETPPPPPPMPTVREVLAGQSARQIKASFVRMWGVHEPDTLVEGTRRSASELSKHYRSGDERPRFERVGLSGASAEIAVEE